MLPLEGCSTPSLRFALSHLYFENGIISMAFSFSETARSCKEPGLALTGSSRSCATEKRCSFCSSDRSLGTNLATALRTIPQNCMCRTHTDLYLVSNLS
ncbi:hypothetical protein TNCV_4798371 [Trichonephila clavipes]|nr:hypothetical protein TNCV_4798371 [Trichonephila clavipes]